MGLNYRILWVDDQIEGFRESGVFINIESHLISLGFTPDIDGFEDIIDAQKNLDSKKYDLILSDYHINENGNGDVLIREVRKGKIFTEILFYSAQPNFDDIAKELYQDRISFMSISAPNGFDELERKIRWLIDQTLYKLQEIESIRGLVMSETSQFDDLMKNILITYFESNRQAEGKEELKNKILKKIKDSLKSNAKKEHELDSKSDIEIVQSRLLDADKMARSVKDLIELEGIDNESEMYKDFFNNYKQHVLELRNDLAHAKTEIDDSGREYLVITREKSEDRRMFDSAKAIEIRKNLLKYRNLLLTLKEKISAV